MGNLEAIYPNDHVSKATLANTYDRLNQNPLFLEAATIRVNLAKLPKRPGEYRFHLGSSNTQLSPGIISLIEGLYFRHVSDRLMENGLLTFIIKYVDSPMKRAVARELTRAFPAASGDLSQMYALLEADSRFTLPLRTSHGPPANPDSFRLNERYQGDERDQYADVEDLLEHYESPVSQVQLSSAQKQPEQPTHRVARGQAV